MAVFALCLLHLLLGIDALCKLEEVEHVQMLTARCSLVLSQLITT